MTLIHATPLAHNAAPHSTACLRLFRLFWLVVSYHCAVSLFVWGGRVRFGTCFIVCFVCGGGCGGGHVHVDVDDGNVDVDDGGEAAGRSRYFRASDRWCLIIEPPNVCIACEVTKQNNGRGTHESSIQCNYGGVCYSVLVGALIHEGIGRATCRVDSGPEELKCIVVRPIG